MARKPAPQKKSSETSFPAMVRKVSLKTNGPQRAYTKNGFKLMAAFVNADISLRHLGLERECDALQEFILQKLNEIEGNLNKKIELYEALIKENKIQGTPKYSSPAEYEVEIRSPMAGRYVSLLQKMDEAVIKIDRVWLSGYMATSAKHTEEKNILRELDGFSNLLIKQVQNAYDKVKAAEEKHKAEPKQVDETEGQTKQIVDDEKLKDDAVKPKTTKPKTSNAKTTKPKTTEPEIKEEAAE